MKYINTNSIHNLLNFFGVTFGVLVMVDYSIFGLSGAETAKLVGSLMLGQNLIKVWMNLARDGVAGLVAPQPPVEK